MKTVRLSEKMLQVLNTQMTNEAQASQIYLSYAVWAEDRGYTGIANFLFRHAEEERNHMMKLLEYILQRGARPKVQAIAAPPEDPSGINNCFVKEQIEEETLALGLLDKSKIAGGDNASDDALYFLDRDLAKMPDEAKDARTVTAANP